MAEINITPLVDVMLTVLIIFMISAPMITHKIAFPLNGKGEPTVNEPQVLGLSIKDTGELYLNGQPTNRAGLDTSLRIAGASGAPVRLEIRPEAHSAYENLASVLAIAQTNRISDLRVEAARAE
jgi:biopolymer transport protein ExbD